MNRRQIVAAILAVLIVAAVNYRGWKRFSAARSTTPSASVTFVEEGVVLYRCNPCDEDAYLNFKKKLLEKNTILGEVQSTDSRKRVLVFEPLR